MNQIRELLLVDGFSPYDDWFKRQQKDIDQAVELWEQYKRRKTRMAKDAVRRRKE